LLAAILYVAFSARLGGLVAHTEVLLAPFSAAGVLLLLRAARKEPGPPRIPVFLAAGLLFGLAVWIKYVPAAPAGLLAGAVLLGTLWRRRAGLSGAVAAGLAFAAGVAAPTLATLLLYWTSGLLDAFLYYNFGFASRYVAAGPGLHMIFRRLEVAWLELWPLLLGAAFLGLALLRRRAGLIPSGSALLLLAWLAGEAIAVAAPRQFFNHYFLLLVPPLSVLSGLALAAGARRIAAPGKEAQAAVLAGGFLALVPGAPHVLATVSVLLTRVDHPRVLAARMLPEIQAGETIYVADWHPILYLPTGTRLPTPVVLGEHLVGSQRFLARIPPDEELARILAANPRFIVMGAVPDNFDPGARAAIEAAVAARYRLHTELELPDGWVRIRAYARLD
jgi:4-amino-4-deoxy-L-arabinose transferase-like glycosyltransferase